MCLETAKQQIRQHIGDEQKIASIYDALSDWVFSVVPLDWDGEEELDGGFLLKLEKDTRRIHGCSPCEFRGSWRILESYDKSP